MATQHPDNADKYITNTTRTRRGYSWLNMSEKWWVGD